MPSRRPKLSLLDKAKQLRSLGFKVHFGNGKKGTTAPAYKSAVSKRWNKLAPLYLTNKKQTFKFFDLDKKELGVIKKSAVAKAQITPGGVFLRVPKGINPKKYKFKIGPDGEMISRAVGPRGGKRKETVYNLDPVEVASDPAGVIDRLLSIPPKPFRARLMVNGNDAGPVDGYAVDPFQVYAPEKIAVIMDPNLDPTGTQAKQHGEAGMSVEEFCEIFQVKVIHQEPSEPTSKKKKSHRHAKKTNRNRRRRF